MSEENNCENSEKEFQSLQEFFKEHGIPLLAENLDDDYTPETLAAYSVNELQNNFALSSETAKNVFTKLERFRKPETKKQQKGLISMIQQIFTPNQKPNFMNAFENVTGINFQTDKDHPMDPCSAANGSTTKFFLQNFGSNSLTYTSFSNSHGWTPLMYACALKREGIVEIILTRNPDISIQNDAKQTALMIAASFGHVTILNKLIQYSKQRSKCNPQSTFTEISGLNLSDANGFTALHFAVYYFQNDAIKYLLNVKANPNISDKDGMTPTLLACSDINRKKCLIDLINAGGKMELRNQNGQNGFDLQKTFCKKDETKSQKYNHF